MKAPAVKVKPKPKLKAGELEKPDVERGDEVFFRHPKAGTHHCGKVVCRGADGYMAKALDVGRMQVPWDHHLGHKSRVRQDVRVVEEGEDGFLVEDPDGNRRFVRDRVPTDPELKAPKPSDQMSKALAGARVILLPHAIGEMEKALKGAPGLSLQPVTDKGGHQTQRWKRTTPKEKKRREPAAPKESGAGAGYGTHNLEKGDHISFAAGSFKGEGEIAAAGVDGATVKDSTGREHQVRWAEVTGHKAATGAKRPEVKPEVKGDQSPRASDKFSANDFAKEHDDAGVTSESVLSHFPPDTADKIREVQQRLKGIEETIDKHRAGDGYQTARQAVHRKIYAKMLSPEKIAAATPKDGEKPTFTILGGRGGSGKSAFNGKKHPGAKVYDEDHAIVLDADEIKGQLPEYEGWNAFQVHEESSDILNAMLSVARSQGLNVVLDATMKTAASAVDKVKAFKGSGYRVEAHYMHLPRQEAAKRAVSRFLGKTQRYVPVDVVLGNTGNEAAFDEVRKHADKWSFRDNNVPEGHAPKLIAEGEGGEESSKA